MKSFQKSILYFQNVGFVLSANDGSLNDSVNFLIFKGFLLVVFSTLTISGVGVGVGVGASFIGFVSILSASAFLAISNKSSKLTHNLLLSVFRESNVLSNICFSVNQNFSNHSFVMLSHNFFWK